MANGTVDEVKVEFIGEDDVSKPATEVADSIKKVGEETEKAGKKTKDAEKQEQSYSKAIHLASAEINKYGKSLTKHFSSLKRVATYRAIRFVLKEITQSFVDGTNNAYQYSKAMDGAFAKSMDNFATLKTYVSNSLGAMLMPLLTKLFETGGALEKLVDKFIEFANTVNQIFARLSGSDTWTRAKKVPIEYAKSTNAATKANEKFKKSLLAIDEINKLQEQNTTNKLSTDSGIDYTIAFEEVTFTEEAKNEIDTLIAKIERIGIVVATVWGTVKALKIADSVLKFIDLLGGGSGSQGLWYALTGINFNSGTVLSGGGALGLLGLALATLAGIIYHWEEWEEMVTGWFYLTNDFMETEPKNWADYLGYFFDNWFGDLKFGWHSLWSDLLGEDTQNNIEGFLDDVAYYLVDNFDKTTSKIAEIFTEVFKGMSRDIKSIFAWINDTYQRIKNGIANLFSGGINTGGINFNLFGNSYATGGFPQQGQMFIANENGAEMVGAIGNRTTVANNQQIVEGIATGVAEANESQNSLLREQNNLLRQLLNKDTNVYPVISTQDITSGLARQNRRNGVTTVALGY